MDTSGVTLTNPRVGDSLTIISTPAELEEGVLRLRLRIPPRCHWAPVHYHTDMDERILVEDGVLSLRVGKRRFLLRSGEGWVNVPRGTRHGFRNDSRTESVTLIGEITPCYQVVSAILATYGMARDGKLGSNNLPRHPLDAALVLKLHRAYTPFLPLSVQSALLNLLGRWGLATRSDPEFLRYREGTS